ncbi:MAG: hypothetical protein KC493_08910 [Bacteriovoracaceae bacterium]|nr:hypothetical protein [Bacteriovoracaceae bacterium]
MHLQCAKEKFALGVIFLLVLSFSSAHGKDKCGELEGAGIPDFITGTAVDTDKIICANKSTRNKYRALVSKCRRKKGLVRHDDFFGCVKKIMVDVQKERLSLAKASFFHVPENLRKELFDANNETEECAVLNENGSTITHSLQASCLSYSADSLFKRGIIPVLEGKKPLDFLDPDRSASLMKDYMSLCKKKEIDPKDPCTLKFLEEIKQATKGFGYLATKANIANSLINICRRQANLDSRCYDIHDEALKKRKGISYRTRSELSVIPYKNAKKKGKRRKSIVSKKFGRQRKITPTELKKIKSRKIKLDSKETEEGNKKREEYKEYVEKREEYKKCLEENYPGQKFSANNLPGDEKCKKPNVAFLKIFPDQGDPPPPGVITTDDESLLRDGATDKRYYSGLAGGKDSEVDPLWACVRAQKMTTGPHLRWAPENFHDGCFEVDLLNFDKQIKQLSLAPSVRGCLEILRMVGLNKVLKSWRMLNGRDMPNNEIPKSCKTDSKGRDVFGEAINKFKQTMPAKLETVFDQKDYRKRFKKAAKRFKFLVDQSHMINKFKKLPRCFSERGEGAKEIECHNNAVVKGSIPNSSLSSNTFIGSLDLLKTKDECLIRFPSRGGMTKRMPFGYPNNWYNAAKRALKKSNKVKPDLFGQMLPSNNIGCIRDHEVAAVKYWVKTIESQLRPMVAKYPLLDPFHDPTKKFGDAPPSKHLDKVINSNPKNSRDMRRILNKPITNLNSKIKKGLDRWCTRKAGSWKDLVGSSHVVNEASNHAPMCKSAFSCVKHEIKRRKSNREFLSSFMKTVGCVGGSLIPVVGTVGVTVACYAVDVLQARSEKNKAKDKLKDTFDCLSTNTDSDSQGTKICDAADYEAFYGNYQKALSEFNKLIDVKTMGKNFIKAQMTKYGLKSLDFLTDLPFHASFSEVKKAMERIDKIKAFVEKGDNSSAKDLFSTFIDDVKDYGGIEVN